MLDVIVMRWWTYWTKRSITCPIEHMDVINLLVSPCYFYWEL